MYRFHEWRHRIAASALCLQIGKGQFSVVYRATCQANGHVVALNKGVIFSIATI